MGLAHLSFSMVKSGCARTDKTRQAAGEEGRYNSLGKEPIPVFTGWTLADSSRVAFIRVGLNLLRTGAQ
jgi:hypothetical protein